MRFLKTLCGLIVTGLVAGCDPCTFHCFGISPKPGLVTFDSGPYTVSVSAVSSDTGLDVEDIRHVHVAWSDAEKARVHRQKGYPPANFANLAATMQNVAGRPLTAAELERLRGQSRYAAGRFVFPDGTVGVCGNGLSKERWCGRLGGQLQLSIGQRSKMLQAGLDVLTPSCRVVSTAPDVLRDIRRENRAVTDRMYAQVTCD